MGPAKADSEARIGVWGVVRHWRRKAIGNFLIANAVCGIPCTFSGVTVMPGISACGQSGVLPVTQGNGEGKDHGQCSRDPRDQWDRSPRVGAAGNPISAETRSGGSQFGIGASARVPLPRGRCPRWPPGQRGSTIPENTRPGLVRRLCGGVSSQRRKGAGMAGAELPVRAKAGVTHADLRCNGKDCGDSTRRPAERGIGPQGRR
jgi:hypothetical protein